MKKSLRYLRLFILLLCTITCTGKSTEILSLASEAPAEVNNGYIVTVSTDGNNRSLAIYDITGTFLTFTHFRDENVTPRGLTVLADDTILMSGDTTDAIYSIDLNANKSLFYGSALFSGAIYDLQYDSATDIIYAIESNRIEAFDPQGTRVTSQYIPNVSGACTLNTPVGLTINTSGNLVVTDLGGTDEILVYDITTSPPTCLSTVAFPGDPYGILQHSDGNLYITTAQNDRIYSADPDGSNAQIIWATDTSVINRPISLAELPNGNLLVGAGDSDTIEQITTAGVRVGTTPFISNPFSPNVFNIVIVGGQSE